MKSSVLVHSEYGKPDQVIKLSTYEIDAPKEKQVLIKVLASPINPADINMLEGKYSIKPELPCVLGSEGVGIIEKIGSEVDSLSIGDRVIMPVSKGPWIG
jgi:mitochondrial enoyl-[acyl-carrier protein] reductase / trans-2-enoyl-CoA reductase